MIIMMFIYWTDMTDLHVTIGGKRMTAEEETWEAAGRIKEVATVLMQLLVSLLINKIGMYLISC